MKLKNITKILKKVMVIKFRKKFLKELVKIPANYRNNIEQFVFNQLSNFNSIEEIGKIEKMKGYNNYFKIRFGQYRVGLKKENDILIIETVKHRKEIYKYFP